MKIKAWIQMGVERRETVIEIPPGQIPPGTACLESWLEELALDWMNAQYGWGWSGAGIENDFTSHEGTEIVDFPETLSSSIPNTRHFRLGREVQRESH